MIIGLIYSKKFKLFTLILFLNIIFSLRYLVSYIDNDFFSFYYVGKGLVSGMSLYKDFFINKGPIHYLFFFFLYLIFRENYLQALLFSSVLVDTVTLFFTFIILEKLDLLELNLKSLKYLILIIASTFFYKSFATLGIMAGFYSENLALLFLLVSILFSLGKGRLNFLLSGIFFSVAVLTRQTVWAFGFVLLITLSLNKFTLIKPFLRKLILFIVGIAVPVVTIVFFNIDAGSLNYFIDSFITYNLYLGSQVGKVLAAWIAWTVLKDPRVLFTLIFVVLVTYAVFKDQKLKRFRFLLILLSLSSFSSVFLASTFYFHHFLQLAPLFLVSLSLLVEKIHLSRKNLLTFAISGSLVLYLLFALVSFFLVFSSFFKNALKKEREFEQKVTENILEKSENLNKKYLLILPLDSRYYIYTNMVSPDRYYHPFSILDSMDSIKNDHKNISKEKVADTLFVAILSNQLRLQRFGEYIDYFGKPFKLKEVDSAFLEGMAGVHEVKFLVSNRNEQK